MRIYSKLCAESFLYDFRDLGISIYWKDCFLINRDNKKMKIGNAFSGVFKDISNRVRDDLKDKILNAMSLIMKRVSDSRGGALKSAEVLPNKVFYFNLIVNWNSDEFLVEYVKMKDQFKCVIDGESFNVDSKYLRGIDLNLRGKLNSKELDYLSVFSRY